MRQVPGVLGESRITHLSRRSHTKADHVSQTFPFPPPAPFPKLRFTMQKADALAFLRQMLGPAAEFRDGQWEAIDLAANRRERLLVVQRTGWGKSVVYFLATKILRA